MYFIYLELFYRGNINDQCQDNYQSYLLRHYKEDKIIGLKMSWQRMTRHGCLKDSDKQEMKILLTKSTVIS